MFTTARNLPSQRSFLGRANELLALMIAFSRRHASVALCGMAGVGKTQLAVEYLHRCEQRYDFILWLNASSSERLQADIRTFVAPFISETKTQNPLSLLREWLLTHKNWLVILDDCSDPGYTEQAIPALADDSDFFAHVLLTTRQQATGTSVSVKISLDPLSEEEGISLLLRGTTPFPYKMPLDLVPPEVLYPASTLVRELGGLPLALVQVNTYCQVMGQNLSACLESFRKNPRVLLGQRREELGDQRDDSVLSLLLREFSTLSRNRIGKTLLHVLALFPNQPEALFVPALCNQITFYEAVATLREHSLILRDGALFFLPTIVQVTLKTSLKPKQQRFWASKVVQLVEQIFPEAEVAHWATCQQYFLQAQQCAELIETVKLNVKSAACLLRRLGTYCQQQARYAEAEAYLTQARQLHEQQLWTDNEEYARLLNALGCLWYKQARFEEATPTHLHALVLREQCVGTNSLPVAESLHNLALVSTCLGQYQQAEQLYQRVLALEEEVLGSDHLSGATLNGLGLLSYEQEKFQEAEAYYQKVLSTYRALPDAHPVTLHALDGLGALAEMGGDFQQALTLYEEALTLCVQLYGQEHLETAHCLNKVADIYVEIGRSAEAEECYQRAIHLGTQKLGGDHPDIALFTNNLAFVLEKKGKMELAREQYQHALEIYERLSGSAHVSALADVLTNLGLLYAQDPLEAEHAQALLQRALDIRERQLGPMHPRTLKTQAHLVHIQQK